MLEGKVGRGGGRGFMAALAVTGLGMVPALTSAQAPGDTPAAGGRSGDEIVVTGTRKEGLSPTETLSPIDVLDGAALSNLGSFDLTDGLTQIAPSFNTQRFPIADGTAFIRPITLRNLSPDHTLVLINGTRRHRSALVNLQLAPLGTVNQGAQAVDFQTIPSGAIERVEVLRDGASAQYGSDAIAGVVNIILKDDAEGGSLYAQAGQYFDGDGERTIFGGNGGFGLGERGFVNVSFELAGSDITSRGAARPDAAFVASVVGADQTPLNGLGQRWGDPDVDASKLFLNAGFDFNENLGVYSHASYSEIDVISDFFYRGPVLDPELEFDARATLQRDADGDFRPDPASQELVDEIRAAGMDPADFLVPDNDSDSGFVERNPIFTLFPGGYNPDFGADLTDLAWVGGINGATIGGFSWDVRARYAENEVEYVLNETINPSLGRLSPTSFRPGTLTQEESSVNADFVQPIDVRALASPLNVAFGVEWRDETYKIGAGAPDSRTAGPTAAVFGVGSDGFQGFPLASAGDFSSDSIAGYLDLEADLTERLAGGLAFRVEEFDEFGSTEDGKLSLRFDATRQLALRATFNTGFRAPTPGQVNTLNVTTTADANGNLIPNGTFPVNHPVAIALGAIPLEPEESTSFTFGLVLTPFDNTSITLDYYDIDVDDRLALQSQTITEDDLPALQAAGAENPELLVGSNANFFSNAFDTNVSGLDLAVTSDFTLARGVLTLDLRHNFNEQDISNVTPGTINASRVFDLENQVPENRSTLTLRFDSGNVFSGHLRANYYDGWESTGGLFSPGDASDASAYGSEILVDLAANFRLLDRLVVSVGGENIFDTRPDNEQDPVLQFLGVRDSLTSPFGFNGGFFYSRLSYDF